MTDFATDSSKNRVWEALYEKSSETIILGDSSPVLLLWLDFLHFSFFLFFVICIRIESHYGVSFPIKCQITHVEVKDLINTMADLVSMEEVSDPRVSVDTLEAEEALPTNADSLSSEVLPSHGSSLQINFTGKSTSLDVKYCALHVAAEENDVDTLHRLLQPANKENAQNEEEEEEEDDDDDDYFQDDDGDDFRSVLPITCKFVTANIFFEAKYFSFSFSSSSSSFLGSIL